MDEQTRRATRIEKNLCATVQLLRDDPAQRQIIEAEAIDASMTGVAVAAAKAIAPDTPVRVTIFFNVNSDEGRFIATEGRVRSCAPEANGRFRLGIELTERPRGELQRWHDMISHWRRFVV